MTNLKQKVYQMFILGTEGEGYKTALKNGLGGIIFFTKDIKAPQQFKELTTFCTKTALIKPFLSIDQEGGRVERTENIHNGKKYLSAKFAYEKGMNFLKKQTQNIANELKTYGINLNFAPCLDVNTNPNNPIIGERAFSSNPNSVIDCGILVSETYRSNGICPCIKHFPGHGDANADSHLTLPEITLNFKDLEENHIRPFKKLIENNIEMIMVAHIHIPHFEKEKIPFSLSKNGIKYLRHKLGYKGVIISDDMIMKGVANFGMTEACVMGIKAGLDMFIYRYSTPEIIKVIENIYNLAQSDNELKNNIEQAYKRIKTLKQHEIFSK